MEFEFDPEKSAKNKAKHGIDFVEVQELWKDVTVFEVLARSETEPRSALIASYSGKTA